MAITYLTRTADEIAADRSIDTEYDDWGRQRYAEFRAEFDANRERLKRERYAIWHAEGKDDLIARLEAVHKRLAEGDAVLSRCKPYTPYVPLADDELF